MAGVCSGRDERGRFVKGNVGGPGNPFARQVAKFRSLLVSEVSEADLQAVTAKLIAMAKAGDVAAMRLFLAYVVGKPTAAVDLDRIDIEEWKIFKDEADMAKEEDMRKVIESEQPSFVLRMGREVKPLLGTADHNLVRELDGEMELRRRIERGEQEVPRDWDEYFAREKALAAGTGGVVGEAAAPVKAAEVEKVRVSPSTNGVLTAAPASSPARREGEVACGSPLNGDAGECEKPRVSPITNGVLPAAGSGDPRRARGDGGPCGEADMSAPPSPEEEGGGAFGDWSKPRGGWMGLGEATTVLRETREMAGRSAG